MSTTPERRCLYGCGRKTRRVGGVCVRCLPPESPDLERGPVELTGGDWVFDPVRRVQVWLSTDQIVHLGTEPPSSMSAHFRRSPAVCSMVGEHRRKSAPRGAGTPLRGASPTERNTDRHG